MKKKTKNNVFGQMAEIVNLIGKARGLALDSGFDLEVNMVVADATKAAKQSVAEVELEALPKALPKETSGRKRRLSWPAVLKRRKEIKAMMVALIEAAGYNGISAAKLASRCRISGQKVGQNLRHLAAEPGSKIILTKTPKGRIVSVSTINKSQV
jgi:hypothetical protein